MPSPTQTWGADQEMIAEDLLTREGYLILERNWRASGGEIDRIAMEDSILCFVEIRARKSVGCGPPSLTVDRKKQARIIRAAAAYMGRFSTKRMPMARFDIVSIVDRDAAPAEVTLIRNAFDAGRRAYF